MELSAANSRFFRLFASIFRSMARRRALPVAWAVIGTSVLFSGCSVGLFSDGKDQQVLSQKPYRPGNQLCSNLDIRSNEVSVPQFREILACLNSNGSLAAIQKLTDRMSDDELLPLVRVGNQQFFKNPVYLYQFEKTFGQWVAAGWIEEDLDQIGALIRNDRWIRSLLALMSKADPKLYPALKLVTENLSADQVSRAVEALAAMVESPAFKSLQQKLLQPGAGALTTRELARALLAYIRSQREPGRVDVDRRVLGALAQGTLFQVLDDFSLSLSPAGDLRETIAKLSALSNQLSSRETSFLRIGNREAPKFRELMMLVNGMHAPIACLKGTQVVPDGVMFVLRELSSRSTAESDRFLRRDNLLNLALMNSFCDYPQALSKHYSALQSLSSTDTLFTAVEFSKSFYRNGSAELLIDALGGEGTGTGIHSSLMSPVEELLPILSEITSRGAMEDLLLVLSSIRVEDRARWQETLSFLSERRPELGQSSIYDVLYDTLARADEQLIADLMDGFHGFMAGEGDVFGPAMRSIRRALGMNNVHPILDVMVGMLSNPEENQDFFEAMFKVARKYPDEFEKAIRLLGDMTRADDGRLKDVVAATVRLFSKFAAQGAAAGVVASREVPSLDSAVIRAHSWSRADIVAIVPQLLPEWKGCSKLSPTDRLDDHSAPGYEEVFEQYLSCMDSDGKHTELVTDVFEYLRGQKTSTGKPLLHHFLDGVRSIDLSTGAIQQLVRGVFDLYDDGTLFRVVDVLPWWLNHDFTGGKGQQASTLVSPLIDLVGEIVRKGGDSLVRVQKFGGQVVQGTAVTGAVQFARKIVDQKKAVAPFTDSESFSTRPFVGPLWQYECVSRPSDQVRRVEQLVGDYRSAVAGASVDARGRPRYAWTKAELRSELLPVANKIADPSRGPIMERLVGFLRMNGLQPGERPSQGRLRHSSELRDWLIQRSNDSYILPYFYPGEENPRLKMVSTLDLFELLVINADFNFVLKDNYALKFLGLVAQAWGDEPRHLWPADIQKMHGSRDRPQTLREAFEEIQSTQRMAEGLIGFPDLPDCPRGKTGQRGISLFPLDVKARVFNLNQIVSVIERNLPDSPSAYRGGMKILRDILYALWSSTPEKDRGTGDGWANNLSLGAKLAKLGSFRQVARAVRLASLAENQGDLGGRDLLGDVLEGMVTAAAQPSAASMAHGLVRNDPGNRFFLSMLDSGYDLFSKSDGGVEIRESLLSAAASLRFPTLAAGVVANGELLFWKNRSEILKAFPAVSELLSSKDVAGSLRAFADWQPQSQADIEERQDFDEILGQAMTATIDGKVLSVDAVLLLSTLSDPAFKKGWDEFRRRLDLLEGEQAYAHLRVRELGEQLLDFIAEQDARTAQASRELRQNLGARLASGEFHEYLTWIERDPDGVRRLLAAVGRSSSNGELKELLRMIRRALPDPR